MASAPCRRLGGAATRPARRAVVAAALFSLGACQGSVEVSYLADRSDEGYATALDAHSLDLAFAERYEATLVLENRGLGAARVDGADVRIWRGGSPSRDAFYAFEMPLDVRLEADSERAVQASIVPAQAVNAILLSRFAEYSSPYDIPHSELREYRDTISVEVALSGDGVGSDAVLAVPVELCFGCLVACPEESAGPSGELCEGTTAPASEPWILGQDEAFDCRLCVGRYSAETCRSFCP